MNLEGRFWIEHNGHSLAGHGRIELLERIRDGGSIMVAARTIKMSYRTVWKRVESINCAAQASVVARTVGGPRSGGSVLTQYGEALVCAYRKMESAHRTFLDGLCRQFPAFAPAQMPVATPDTPNH